MVATPVSTRSAIVGAVTLAGLLAFGHAMPALARADEPPQSIPRAHGPWSLDDLTRIIVKRSPGIAARRATHGVLEGDERQARARRNPFLLSDNGTAEFTYRLGLTQSFETGPVRKRLAEVTAARRSESKHEIAGTELALRHEIRALFTTAVVADREETALRSILADLDALIEAHRDDESLEVAQRIEARTVRVRIQQALDEAALEHLRADIELNVMLGASPISDLPLDASSLPTTPAWWPRGETQDDWQSVFAAAYVNLVDDALRNRHDLAAAKSRVAEAIAEDRVARARAAPDLEVSVGPDLNSSQRPWLWGAFVMISLEMPFFDRKQGTREAAQSKRRVELHRHDAILEVIARDVALALASAAYTSRELQRYETVFLPDSDAALKLSLRNASGADAFMRTVHAYESRAAVIVAHATTLASWHAALADVDFAIGLGDAVWMADSPPPGDVPPAHRASSR